MYECCTPKLQNRKAVQQQDTSTQQIGPAGCLCSPRQCRACEKSCCGLECLGQSTTMRVAAVTLQHKHIVSASTRSVHRAAGAPFPEGVFRDLARAVSSLPAASISVTAMEPSELPLHTCIHHAYLESERTLLLRQIILWHSVTRSITGKLAVVEAASEIFSNCSC